MLKAYNSMSKMKSTLQEKIIRRLEFNSEWEADEELIDDFIDTAINEISLWRKLTTDTEFLSGMYDNNIIRFVIQSYNMIGTEGQTYESNGQTAKQYGLSPLAVLKSSIPQRI